MGALAVLALVAGCGQSKEDRILFDGHYFKTKAKVVDKRVTLADFTVRVDDVSASLDGAREAGRYAGTRYCIENYGTSRIKWKVGPDTEPQQLRVVDDTLTFAGTCQRP
ncbi:hypothetical protein AVO45_09685 [Ruegeria marisrubri]|uniref:Uncharacterized protein n=1 Tax=Ruegeria marisrubri TaxID=1685379 RepID=A0A0X3TM76_9RHOB|nr:hypothetical protein [Ruegeria marisrubri]KUJ76769.1 hypothetical protein AVO45_09685 [Ruegeria marisrubri]